MNLLFSCIGKRGYIADFFRPHLKPEDKIIGTSNTKWTPGFEHCDKNFVIPDIANPNYIPRVREICKEESVNAILSFYDPDVSVLSKHYDDFVNNGIIPIFPRSEIVDTCFDKYKTYQFLSSNHIRTAKTYIDINSATTAIENNELFFPLYVKPRFGFGSWFTYKARNFNELTVFFNHKPNMIVQEELQGEAVNFDILNDLRGNVVSVVPWRKYLSRMGETEQSQTFYSNDVIDFGVRLGNLLKNVGPLDADLYMVDNKISVLEINLRFGGGYPVSHLAGADFPSLIIKMINGEEITPQIGKYKENIVMMKDNLIIGGLESEYFNSFQKKSDH